MQVWLAAMLPPKGLRRIGDVSESGRCKRPCGPRLIPFVAEWREKGTAKGDGYRQGAQKLLTIDVRELCRCGMVRNRGVDGHYHSTVKHAL